GVGFATVPQAPPGLPSIEVPSVDAGDPATRAVVEVLGQVPQQVRESTVTLSAKSPGSVQLTLADGRIVKWGNAADSERKAMVLAALLTRPGKVFDVSAPDLPTVA
ncbi:MAG: cell division protein FtsQ/DivIB, partial [Kibdelosporangium sp.]